MDDPTATPDPAFFVGAWAARSTERLLLGLIRIRGDSVARFNADGTFEARMGLWGRAFDLDGRWRLRSGGPTGCLLAAELQENWSLDLPVKILDADRFEIPAKPGWLYRRDAYLAHRIR